MTTTPVHPTPRLTQVREHPNRTDASQVEVMSGLGADEDQIASHLKITTEALRQHYAKELENGPKEANLRVAQIFHELATSGEHPIMTQKWMELRAGWGARTSDSTYDQADREVARDKLLKLLNRGK